MNFNADSNTRSNGKGNGYDGCKVQMPPRSLDFALLDFFPFEDSQRASDTLMFYIFLYTGTFLVSVIAADNPHP